MRSVRYTRTARLLHWLMAGGIITAVGLAISFDGLPLSPHKIHLINYHKWAGLTVLWLWIARALWRLTHRPPELPMALAAWERKVASATHSMLYVLMAATPVLGWWLSSAKGFPLKYLSLVPLPDLGPKDKAIAEFVQPVHLAFAWSLIVLAALHATAALKHHFIHRNDILHRII